MKTAVQMLAFVVVLAGTLPCPGAAEKTTQRCTGAVLSSPFSQDGSETCLACHDGVLARNIMPTRADWRTMGGQGNHPVMISYEAAYARAPASFVSPAQLDTRVKLYSGKIQCVSCHMLSAIGEWKLVKPNVRSELCLSCHRK